MFLKNEYRVKYKNKTNFTWPTDRITRTLIVSGPYCLVICIRGEEFSAQCFGIVSRLTVGEDEERCPHKTSGKHT